MRLNKQQLVPLWIGIGIICFLGLYPPWVDTLDIDGMHFERPGPHASLFDPPTPRKFDLNLDPDSSDQGRITPCYSTGLHIDVYRLLIYWSCIALIATGAIISLESETSKTGE